MKALLVAEGSGGHLIPALEVARQLAHAGTQVSVWYATRAQTGPLTQALAQQAQAARVAVNPLPVEGSNSPFARLWECGRLWSKAHTYFDAVEPDVVVGFGGWVSAPILLAARLRKISCLLHEQNVVMGRANRWLSRWVDRVAVSFRETQASLPYAPSVVTGMPVRQMIGQPCQGSLIERIGFANDRPILLVVGGSQGSQFLNQAITRLVAHLTTQERAHWQFLHVTGAADEAKVRQAYANAQLRAWVTPFLMEMDAAYANATLVISRAGASTIAELARSGTPAILIPYPYAGAHQRANAQIVESAGGGLVIEEADATAECVLFAIRRILGDGRLQQMMRAQMRTLDVSDATQRLAQVVLELSQ